MMSNRQRRPIMALPLHREHRDGRPAQNSLPLPRIRAEPFHKDILEVEERQFGDCKF
jgi:hypothetical protein